MSVIQELPPSLDQLLQLGKKKNKDEMIDLIRHDNLHVLKISDTEETLLHIAAKRNYCELVGLLIEAGSDVNAQDISGKTAIMLAIESEIFKAAETIKILLQAKANIHIIDRYGNSAVQLVLDCSRYVNDEVHKLLLNAIHQECMNNSRMTAEKLMSLHYPLCDAVLLGNVEVIEHMIIRGCLVNQSDKKFTVLGRAVQHMHVEIVKLLIRHGADVDLADSMGYLPIFHYCFYYQDQQPEIIEILLNRTILLKELRHNERKNNQLRRAFEFGNKEVIQMLLEHQNDILHIRDARNQTPLHYLSGNYHSDVTSLLKNQKIDVNIKDKLGRTPLYMATLYLYTHINTFEFLLVNGADVNAETYAQDVPLFSLCRNSSISKEKYLKIVGMFLQHDLNIQFVGENNETVFDIITRDEAYFKAEPLIAHLIIHEEQNNCITEYIRSKVNAHRVFKNYFNECKAEVVEMKNSIIIKNLTLYTILINKISDERIMKMCRLSRNSLFNLEKCKKKLHPNNHYYALVQKRVSSVVSKIELLHKATTTLCKLLKLGNDHIVTSEVIDYLGIPDLQTLLKVYKME